MQGALFTINALFGSCSGRSTRRALAVLLPLKARPAATDRLIDQVVYQLYGLTKGEIVIVEGCETETRNVFASGTRQA